MSISVVEARVPEVSQVYVSDDELSVELSDGRSLTVPTCWYPRLAFGTSEERANWTIIDAGRGVHWADLDEDVSLEGLLLGQGSQESQTSLKRWLDARRGARTEDR